MFRCLARSSKYSFAYIEAPNLSVAVEAYRQFGPDIVICNYHQGASAFLNPNQPRAFGLAKTFCILHEDIDGSFSRGFYDYYIFGDPQWALANNFRLSVPRFVFDYENKMPDPEIPTFGTFGFSFPGKDYNKFLETIQSQYDKAIIKIHSPQNDVMIHDHHQRMLADVMSKKKDGIDVQFSRNFLEREQVLDFLASNTANVFIYDKSSHLDGISSVIDFAIAAKRPVIVNKCALFRHVLHLPINIEDHDVKSIVSRGATIFDELRDRWSEQKNIEFYENLFERILAE
jgi:hypothetical protein